MNSSSVLLLRLSAPLQAWGVQSRFTVRDTGREPSKSGVVGLLCAALGRGRDQPIDDLAALRMAARVDQEGRILRDYHVAGVGGYLIDKRFRIRMIWAWLKESFVCPRRKNASSRARSSTAKTGRPGPVIRLCDCMVRAIVPERLRPSQVPVTRRSWSGVVSIARVAWMHWAITA
jgi:CRISPR-associated Cas5-like protein